MLRPQADLEDAFAAALLDPEQPPPREIVGRDGAADEKRFAVYRNNVVVSLTDALAARFPVTRLLVGETFFRAMARIYVGEHKPRSPLLFDYGADFAGFIDRFEPARAVPYLADVARLEIAWGEAYHAPEAKSLPVEALAGCLPLPSAPVYLRLHPSLHLLRSPYPVATIWAGHHAGEEVVPPSVWEAECMLVVRPEVDVRVHRPLEDTHAFVADLAAGESVQSAAARAQRERHDFEVGAHLYGLFELGAVVGIETSGGRT